MPEFAERVTVWGILILIAAAVIGEFLGQTLVFTTGWYSFHIIDPAVIMVGLAAAIQLLRGRLVMDWLTVLGLGIVCVLLLNFVRGLASDPSAAFLAIRANGTTAFILAMAVAMRPSAAIMLTIRRALVFASLALGLLVLMRLATSPTLFMTFEIDPSNVNDGGRPLSVIGTFILALASIIVVSDLIRLGWKGAPHRLGLAIFLPLVSLLTAQGTANVAMLISVGALAMIERGPLRAPRMALGGLFVALGLAAAFLSRPYLVAGDYIERRFENMGMRQMVWDSLWAKWESVPFWSQLIGLPAGQTPEIYIFANGQYRLWEYSIHSMYWGALPMIGYIGLAAYISLLAGLTIALTSELMRRDRGYVLPAFPVTCCLAVAVLSLSYEIRGVALLGLLIPIWWIRAAREFRMTAAPISAGHAMPVHLRAKQSAASSNP